MCKMSTVPGDAAVWRAGQQALLAQMAVAEVLGVRLTELAGQERGGPRVALARQIAMYLCRLVYGMRVADIALAFGRDRTTAAHALRRVEEAREDPDFDRRIAWLETMLQRAGGIDD